MACRSVPCVCALSPFAILAASFAFLPALLSTGFFAFAAAAGAAAGAAATATGAGDAAAAGATAAYSEGGQVHGPRHERRRPRTQQVRQGGAVGCSGSGAGRAKQLPAPCSMMQVHGKTAVPTFFLGGGGATPMENGAVALSTRTAVGAASSMVPKLSNLSTPVDLGCWLACCLWRVV